MAKRIYVSTSVLLDPNDAAMITRVVEAYSRAATGLALEGLSVSVS